MVFISRGITEHECGCITEEVEHDVDRPFMYYTETYTNHINRCDKHAQEEKERLQKEEERREIAERERIRKNEERKKHIAEVDKIMHMTLIPIKLAIEKYRAHHRAGDSTQWIRKCITSQNSTYKEILLVEKVRNKWMCSKERLDFVDFNII